LLHLLKYGKHQDQWDVPFAVTQSGISKSTKILRNNIPRTMNKLIGRGFVHKKSLHVRGTIKRRIVYFLTTEGRRKAKAIEDSLQETFVFLKDLDGKTKEVKLREISQYLPDETPLLNVVLHLSEDSVFDCGTFQSDTVGVEEGYVDFAMQIPKLKYFFDRKTELNTISKWLGSETSKLLVLYGIAGCGKTTLANKVMETVKSNMNVFWYQFHEWDTIRNILTSLSRFLYQVGRKELRTYLNANKSIDINEVSELLEVQLQAINGLLVFDDYHKTDGQIVSFFSALRERLERISKIKMVVIGRHISPFYNSREIVVRGLVTEMQLGGLDEEGSRALLKLRNIKEFDEIYKLTEGHPLFLELIESPEDLKRDSNPTRYIHEEIFSKLAEDEKTVLRLMSVFRYPVPPEVLFIDPTVGYETLRSLKNKSLIYETFPGKYETHDLVKDFFYGTLTPQSKQHYHGTAAQHYLKAGEGYDSIEAQHHFLSAGKYEEAAKLAIEQGPELIRKGHLEAFMTLLQNLDAENISIEQLLSITILKGDILSMQASYEEALRYYDEALILNRKVQSQEKQVEIHRKIGDFHEKRNSLEDALKYYEQSLRLSTRLKNSNEMAEAYKGLGRILRKLGKRDEAMANYQKSIELLQRDGFELDVAKGHNTLGQICAEKGDRNKALEHYEKSMELSKKLRNPYLTGLTAFLAAYTYTNPGIAGEDEDWEGTLEYHERYAEIARKMGFERGRAYALTNAAKSHAKKFEFDKALGYLDKVLETSKKLKEKLMCSSAYKGYGIVYKLKKEWDKSLKYFKDSIKILEDMGVSRHLADVYFEVALMYKEKGNKKEANIYITKATGLYEKLGDKDKVEMMKEKFG